MSSELERRFDAAMMSIYRRAKAEAGYNAARFLHMVGERGGLAAAQTLLHAGEASEGYTELYLRGRLDLTVEALIFDNPEWHTLFTNGELDIARERLATYRYGPAIGASQSPLPMRRQEHTGGPTAGR